MLALLVCVGVVGCAGPSWVTLRATPSNPLAGPLKLLDPRGPRPTDRTRQLLRRYGLMDELAGDRRELIHRLHDTLATDRSPDPEVIYAIAELAYLGANRAEVTDRQAALEMYGLAVTHAYWYLFDDQFGAAANPYDPQFRGACDLYNTALEGTLRIARDQGMLRPGVASTVQLGDREIDLQVVSKSDRWRPEDFETFQFVSDYQVNGLRNHYHEYGLGVPLIAVRGNRPAESPAERFYPPNLSFPVTAFLRLAPGGDLKDLARGSAMKIQIELYDPLVAKTIEVARRRVPLESDLSTPLAYFLNQPEFSDTRLSTAGLLNPDDVGDMRGLYMLAPYQPGKIPVVMVHGLWSSPVTWMEMFNDLQSEPEIRDHYQFWFYLYPTGQPFWFSAAQMREDLINARAALDFQKQDFAFDQMVLVGHSMGGLVSKLQSVNSEDDFWRSVSDQPFSALQADPATIDTLSKTMFFQPNPSVRRVVTIATPHRGSEFANDATRWISRKIINVSNRFLLGRRQLLRDNPGFFRKEALLTIDTSIDSLAPESPFLPVLLSANRAPWVTYHNIVGQIPSEGLIWRLTGEGDGVVPLASAQLDPSELSSQIVVSADHVNVHRHPLAIREVRRILLEHLESLRTFPAPLPVADASAAPAFAPP